MTRINLRRMIKNRVPALKWLPLYKAEDALGDLVAGLTVGLTLIPQVFSNLNYDISSKLRYYDNSSSNIQSHSMTPEDVIYMIAGDSLRGIGGPGAAIRALQRVCGKFRLHHFRDMPRSQYRPNRAYIFINVDIREVRTLNPFVKVLRYSQKEIVR